MTTTLTREAAEGMFYEFITQRPGLDSRNYGPGPYYNTERSSIYRDRVRALKALDSAFMSGKDYREDLLSEASRRAFSGRLSIIARPEHPHGWIIRYVMGQYWPTEFRLAAANVLETYATMLYDAEDREPITGPFTTIAEVRAANRANGGHWFDKDTMRFFNSRIESKLIGGKYFISSEQSPPFNDQVWPREYSVRVVSDDASIDTVNDFQEYKTKQQARAAIDALIGRVTA